MSYAVRVTDLALQKLREQPAALHEAIIGAFQRLGQNPTQLSRRSPGPPPGQFADLRLELPNDLGLWIVVTFLHGQDEQTIYIERFLIEFGA